MSDNWYNIDKNEHDWSNESITNEIQATTDNFSEVCKDILNNEEKIIYAKKTLSKEQYDIIWEEWIINVDMTKEKLDILWNSDLSIIQIIAIWWEFISHKKMTSEKLIVIGYMLSDEDILRIWPKNLAEMSINELNEIV